MISYRTLQNKQCRFICSQSNVIQDRLQTRRHVAENYKNKHDYANDRMKQTFAGRCEEDLNKLEARIREQKLLNWCPLEYLNLISELVEKKSVEPKLFDQPVNPIFVKTLLGASVSFLLQVVKILETFVGIVR